MKKMGILLLVLVLLLAACTQDNQTEAAADNAAVTEESAAADAGDSSVLVMATNASFPPYEFYEGGEIVGIDAEIAAKIAEKLGMELRIDDMNFDSIINAVSTGKADIGMAGMSVTEDRLENVNFSESYATGIQSIIVREDSEITDPEDLEGKMIGVQLATTGDIYVADEFGEEHVDRYNKGADAIMSLTQGKVDAVIIDNAPAQEYVRVNEGLKVLDTEYAEEDYAIAFAKDNEALLAQVNEALQALIEDGTVQSIIDKYIQP